MYKPDYIAIAAYKDSKYTMKKRLKFYVNRLKTMNYKIYKIDNETYEDPIYYMERI